MEFVYSAKNPDAPVAFASFGAMHSVFEIVVPGVSEQKARNVAGKAEAMVAAVEKKLNRHDPDSVFSKLDSSSGLATVEVDDEVFSILQFCEAFRKSTAGYFDIAALSISEIRPAYIMSPEKRTVLRFSPRVAPYKAAIFPLVKNKPEIMEKARSLYLKLRRRWNVFFDAGGAIGRRYRRQDEIGTPYCITIDFDTENDHCVTIRDRDTMEQVRLPISDVSAWLREKVAF